jgi:hypothetical protein
MKAVGLSTTIEGRKPGSPLAPGPALPSTRRIASFLIVRREFPEHHTDSSVNRRSRDNVVRLLAPLAGAAVLAIPRDP